MSKSTEIAKGDKEQSYEDIMREGREALIRLPLNLGIVVADMAPGGIGEIPELVATWAKILSKLWAYIRWFKVLELTPDVSLGASLGMDLAGIIPEIFSAGFLPSALASNEGIQIVNDLNRVRKMTQAMMTKKKPVDEASKEFEIW